MAYYDISIVRDLLQEDGTLKKVTEKYLCKNDNNIMTDAIATVIEEINPTEEVEATSAKKTKITSVLGEWDEHIYDAKVSTITEDEKTQKEKRTTIQHAVWAMSVAEAKEIVDMEYDTGLLSYEIKSISETAYKDIINQDTF